MKIIISGSTGFIGTALTARLKEKGYLVKRLIRKKSQMAEDTLFWSEENKHLLDEIEGADVVINLAGESIFSRWNVSKKKALFESRVETTRRLAHLFKQCKKKPTFINASAIGYYGNQGMNIITEANPKGCGFLATLCEAWENAILNEKEDFKRVIILRFGIILDKKGGALKKMLFPFKMGLGGPLGNGNQFMSWITLEDTLNAILFLLESENLHGVFNLTTPYPVTNREFTKVLGKVLRRPTFFKIPAFLLKIIFGEMADETLLISSRVIPQRLIETGFNFKSPHLEEALKLHC